MAVPRNPIVIDTSDTFNTWLSNTNLAINVLKNIITDTVLTHPSASAFTVGSTITQATTGATGIVQVSTTEATTLSDLGTGTWGISNDVTQSAPTSVTVAAASIDVVTVSHLATTDAALTTPTLTAPVIATITSGGNTLTLPTSADTLVGRATTDTLTNKTLTGPVISGGSMSGIAITNNAISSAPTISVDDGGTIGTDTDADAITIAAAGAVTFSQRDVHTLGITVANGQTIGSASDADAITIASAGAVTFSQRDVHTLGITVANGQTIGSASDADAITIATAGVVTFSQRDVHSAGITVADAGQIGSASATSAISIASTGIVTFADDLIIKDAGTIGSATDPDAIAIGADGDVTLTQDLELQHDGATISLGTNDDVVITHVADDGLIIRNMVGGFTKLAIHASDTDVADGNLLGEISFVAPVEGAGSDAILPAAAIAARSEGDFSATNNATELVFNTGASEDASIGATGGKMILSSAGNLNLTAGGLQFPATFSNETNANTLDDYEEGTFTPTLDSYGYTPDRIEGRYTKIGRMVFAIVVFDPSGTSADYSEFLLEALPFVAIDDNAPGIVTFGTSQSYDYDNDYNPQYFFILKNTVQVKGWDVSGGVIEYVGRAREISRGNEIILGIQYETAS